MDTKTIISKLDVFKGMETKQSWRMDCNVAFENEFINVIRIDSSNVTGGSIIKNGKQWSIIVDIKKDFRYLHTWKSVSSYLKEDIAITKVTKGKNLGKYGIRLYRMASNPTNEIIYELLNYIFG